MIPIYDITEVSRTIENLKRTYNALNALVDCDELKPNPRIKSLCRQLRSSIHALLDELLSTGYSDAALS